MAMKNIMDNAIRLFLIGGVIFLALLFGTIANAAEKPLLDEMIPATTETATFALG